MISSAGHTIISTTARFRLVLQNAVDVVLSDIKFNRTVETDARPGEELEGWHDISCMVRGIDRCSVDGGDDEEKRASLGLREGDADADADRWQIQRDDH